MAILEVTLTQSYAGQEVINRWNYQSNGTPAGVSHSFALLTAFGGIPPALTPNAFPDDTVMRLIQVMQVSGVSFVSLLVQDIIPNADFFENTYTGVSGVRAPEGLPPYTSYGFRTNRVNRTISRGYKRFVGAAEDTNAAGGVIEPSFVSGTLEPLATAMGETLSYNDSGNTLTYTPVVCQKEKYVVPGSDPVRYAYRYYQTPGVQEEFSAAIGFWQVYPEFRSQVSRQRGRGR